MRQAAPGCERCQSLSLTAGASELRCERPRISCRSSLVYAASQPAGYFSTAGLPAVAVTQEPSQPAATHSHAATCRSPANTESRLRKCGVATAPAGSTRISFSTPVAVKLWWRIACVLTSVFKRHRLPVHGRHIREEAEPQPVERELQEVDVTVHVKRSQKYTLKTRELNVTWLCHCNACRA